MASGDVSRRVIEDYLAYHGTVQTEKVLELFSESAVVEDPAGSQPLDSARAIRTFYEGVHRTNGALLIERVGPILVAGADAVLHVRAALAKPGGPAAMDVIYFFEVDPSGRIQRLRAYY